MNEFHWPIFTQSNQPKMILQTLDFLFASDTRITLPAPLFGFLLLSAMIVTLISTALIFGCKSQQIPEKCHRKHVNEGSDGDEESDEEILSCSELSELEYWRRLNKLDVPYEFKLRILTLHSIREASTNGANVNITIESIPKNIQEVYEKPSLEQRMKNEGVLSSEEILDEVIKKEQVKKDIKSSLVDGGEHDLDKLIDRHNKQ